MGEKELIRELYREYRRCMIAKDVKWALEVQQLQRFNVLRIQKLQQEEMI